MSCVGFTPCPLNTTGELDMIETQTRMIRSLLQQCFVFLDDTDSETTRDPNRARTRSRSRDTSREEHGHRLCDDGHRKHATCETKVWNMPGVLSYMRSVSEILHEWLPDRPAALILKYLWPPE